MDPNLQDTLRALVENPSERLTVELKDWIDIATPHGASLMLRACLALRNSNGGFLLIGFDKATNRRSPSGIPADVREAWNEDKVSELVGRHASEPFPVDVSFVETEAGLHPVLYVHPGVTRPVAVRTPLVAGSKELVPQNAVFVRTVKSNHRVSSAPVQWDEWEEIIQTCVGNRTHDVLRALVIQLRMLPSHQIRTLFSDLVTAKESIVAAGEGELDRLWDRFVTSATSSGRGIPLDRGFVEAYMALDGLAQPPEVGASLLDAIGVHQPSLTGWPLWLVSRGFRVEKDRPLRLDDGWEALIYSAIWEGRHGHHLDFIRFEAKCIYDARGFVEDFRTLDGSTELAGSSNWFLIDHAIGDVVEALASGVKIARAYGANDDVRAIFRSRWRGLSGRSIGVHSHRHPIAGGKAHQSMFLSAPINVRVGDGVRDVTENVARVTRPLGLIFDGYEIPVELLTSVIDARLNKRAWS